MATAPSTKPYRAVAVTIGDLDDEDGGDGTSITIMDADNNNNFDSAHLMSDQMEAVAGGRWASSTSQFRFRIVVASIFAITLLVVGGRSYHNKRYSLSSDATHISGGEDITGYNNMELAPNADNTNQEIFDIDNNGGDILTNSEEESPTDDYFVPLTADEREDMKEMLRSTLRETKNSLLSSTIASDGNHRYLQKSPQRTLVLDSDLPKQFMHMHHMKTGKKVDTLHISPTSIFECLDF